MLTIAKIIDEADQKLKPVSQTPRLDAEILLAHILNNTRSYIFTHKNESLLKHHLNSYLSLLERRTQGEPIAYLIGHKEFWSLDFVVTKDTLIPRPETELLVQLILSLFVAEKTIKVADLGVGCGAIALSLAVEKPHWLIHGTDISEKALEIAQLNLHRHGVKNVFFNQGSWCEALKEKDYQIIVANPPYIAENDPHLQFLSFEPRSALVSGNDGLEDIKVIIEQSRDYLAKNGLLFLEHGFEQQQAVMKLMLESGFEQVEGYLDVAGQPRVVSGRWNP